MIAQGSSSAKKPKEKVLVWVCAHSSAQDPSFPASETLFLLLKTHEARGSFWQPITGTVDPGEEIETAAAREMAEETGLVTLGPLVQISDIFEYESRRGPARETPFLAEVSWNERMKVKLDSREHVSFQWCSAERAFELLKYESNIRVLRDAVHFLKQKNSGE